jgi:DNA-binding MarR family transcriptional regulator
VRDQFVGDDIILENALAFVIQNTYQRIRSLSYREFNQHGLEITPEQWIVLVRLWARDGLTPSELSESTLRDRPTMTRILDTMEKSGLVRRDSDPKDGRGRVIHLTKEGKALRKKLVPIAKTLVKRLEQGISESDLRVTRRTLQKIMKNLE